MLWTLGVAVLVVSAACGDSKSSLIPTAPSAASAETAGAVEGEYSATAKGPKPGNGNNNGNGNGNANGRGRDRERTPGNTSPDPTRPVPPGKSKVEFEGFVQAVSSSSLLVNSQVIMVTSETVIRHGNRLFELADLNPGDRVHVRANRVTPAETAVVIVAEATLEATEIKLQNPDEDSDGETDGLVSVTASDASASESPAGSNPGAFLLTRTGSATQLALPLAVSFTLTGTALNGTDYTAPLTATFLANEATVEVPIVALVDAVTEDAENVILTLTGVAPYELGSPITATVMITDTVNPLVSLSVEDDTATEAGDPGRFVLTRTGDLATSLTVTVAFSGTALNGTDYQTLLTTVTIPAFQSTMNLEVNPVEDAAGDASETVIVSVVDGVSYDLGPTPTAQLTITGN
jgi:hypothetical protein